MPMRNSSDSSEIRKWGLAVVLLSPALAFSEPMPQTAPSPEGRTVLTESQDFDRSTLLSPTFRGPSVSGFSLLNPNRFSMRQSYSVGFSSSSYGSQSAGLYLNTISYRLADPLTLTADIGFHTPFHSTIGPNAGGFGSPGLGSSFVLPHVGLEYRPSENSTLSLHFFNGPDAVKAYGHSLRSPWDPWNR
jgi:hypothetical protein